MAVSDRTRAEVDAAFERWSVAYEAMRLAAAEEMLRCFMQDHDPGDEDRS
jgi:hypothetical protein